MERAIMEVENEVRGVVCMGKSNVRGVYEHYYGYAIKRDIGNEWVWKEEDKKFSVKSTYNSVWVEKL